MADAQYRRLACSVATCDGQHKAHGFCLRHYRQWQRGGVKQDATACAHCSKPFDPTNAKGKYCSKQCKMKAWWATNPEARRRQRKREPTLCAYWTGYCADCGAALGGQRRRGRCEGCTQADLRRRGCESARLTAEALHRAAGRVTACEECNVEFCPLYGHSNCALCQVCRAARDRKQKRIHRMKRKAAERGVHAERVDPIRVFERDRWRCHLCGCRTPKAKRGTCDDDAPELDHLIPLSKGGPHTYANTACACRRCNREKADRPLGQLLLVG